MNDAYKNRFYFREKQWRTQYPKTSNLHSCTPATAYWQMTVNSSNSWRACVNFMNISRKLLKL